LRIVNIENFAVKPTWMTAMRPTGNATDRRREPGTHGCAKGLQNAPKILAAAPRGYAVNIEIARSGCYKMAESPTRAYRKLCNDTANWHLSD